MAIQVQHRRGTGAANATFIGAEGELIWLTDEKRWVGHDGATAGGVKMARFDEISEDTYREVGNAAIVIQTTDGRIALNASLTAPRTATLPAANAVPAGKTYRISDKVGGINGANILNLTKVGGDTINGGAGPFAMASARGAWEITSDGVSAWAVKLTAAADISFVPSGNLASASVQGALVELDSEKQAADPMLTALAALTTAADKLLYFTGADAPALADLSSQGRTFLAATTVAGQRGVISRRSVAAKTGAYSVVAGDFGNTIVATGSSSWTLSLLAAATAGDGFPISVKNAGTGRITVDPNSTETVNGLSTIGIYPGDAVDLVCDGANWYALFQSPTSIVSAETLGSNTSVVDFSLPAEFKSFSLELDGFEPTAAAALGLRFSLDFGSTFYSSSGNYAWTSCYDTTSTTNTTTYKPSGSILTTTAIELTPGTQLVAAGNQSCFLIDILTRSTSRNGSVSWRGGFSGSFQVRGGGSLVTNTADYNAGRLFYSSGSIVSGAKYKLIGNRG